MTDEAIELCIRSAARCVSIAKLPRGFVNVAFEVVLKELLTQVTAGEMTAGMPGVIKKGMEDMGGVEK
mgnify:CR=1 FL=1